MPEGLAGAYQAAGAAGTPYALTGQAGAVGTSTTPGGAGGASNVTAGAGGAKTDTGAAAGGAGGSLAITGGVGGATASSGTDAGGAGTSIAVIAGAGGAASAGTGNGGAGGSVTLTPGAGGTSAGGTAGARGTIALAGPVSSPVTAVQDLTTGATLVLPTSGMTKRLSASGGAVTGIILPAGLTAGQQIVLFNIEATNTITFAASGTSRVADGASAVLLALRALHLTWDSVSSLWYRSG